MKIALVSQEYPPETARGGIGSQTYIKAQGLAALGHQIWVISRSHTDRYEITDGAVTIIRIPGMEDHMYHMTDIVEWITHSVVVAAELDALHSRVGLDLIDFPEWAAEGYIYLLNRSQWYGVPTVIQLHGPLVMFGQVMGWPDTASDFYRIGTEMEATGIRLADAVYSSSQCSTDWIRNHYHSGAKQIPVIHLGVDTTKFRPLPLPKPDRPTIVFIGKIVPNKGVEELVEAAARISLQFPGLQLRLIGRGDEKYTDRLRAKAAALGADDLLQLPGFIDKEALPQELSQAHIFCAPSYYEGGPGFVYLEAMACGLPVVGCSGSGVEEIVEPGITGLLVPPGDSGAVEQALHQLLSDERVREEMGRQAREYVIREADSRHCLKKLERFYFSVLQAKSLPAAHHES